MTEVKIKMNDGKEFVQQLENYNPVELTEELNGNKQFLNIGQLILQRYSIVHVTPAEDEPINEN